MIVGRLCFSVVSAKWGWMEGIHLHETSCFWVTHLNNPLSHLQCVLGLNSAQGIKLA